MYINNIKNRRKSNCVIREYNGQFCIIYLVKFLGFVVRKEKVRFSFPGDPFTRNTFEYIDQAREKLAQSFTEGKKVKYYKV